MYRFSLLIICLVSFSCHAIQPKTQPKASLDQALAQRNFFAIHQNSMVNDGTIPKNMTQHYPTMARWGKKKAVDSVVSAKFERPPKNADVCEDDAWSYSFCKHSFFRLSSKKTVNGLIHRKKNDNLPIVFGGWTAGCAVSDEHQFIYVHVLKDGGSATKVWLQDALCPQGIGTCDEKVLRIVACESEMIAHPDYFRWTLARSVESRAVSIWAMSLWFSGKYDLKAFWENDDRWSQTGLSKDHGRQQADFLTDEDGYLAVDFIGRLENGEEDVAKVADILDIPAMTSYVKKNGFVKPVHSNTFGTDKLKDEGKSAEDLVKSTSALGGITANFDRDVKMGF